MNEPILLTNETAQQIADIIGDAANVFINDENGNHFLLLEHEGKNHRFIMDYWTLTQDQGGGVYLETLNPTCKQVQCIRRGKKSEVAL